jgi:integrase
VPDRITRLLLVTGQRRGEVEQWRPDFLQDGVLTIPGTITKNHTEQFLPLEPMALQLLDTFPQPYTSWGKYKAMLDERTGINKPWMLRDLRRTFSTGLADLGVALHIIERLLNHITGTLSPIARVYNKARYIAEMKTATALWEKKLSALCGIDAH